MFRLAIIAATLILSMGTATAGDWQRDGLAWRVVLTDADVQELKADAAAVARWVPDPSARTAINTAAEVIDLVNELGRRNGIEVSGVIGVPGAFVWPATGTTPFVRLVSFQEDTRREFAEGTRLWTDLTRRVGGRLSSGWADANRFVLRANPDGTVSLAGGGTGATKFWLTRSRDGAVCLWHADGNACPALPPVGPSVRGAFTRLTETTNGVARWKILFRQDGTASLIPHLSSDSPTK